MNKRLTIAVLCSTVLILCFVVIAAAQQAPPELQSRPASKAADDSPIYVDALADDWQDWSWDTTCDLDNADPVHGGSASIAITYTAAWAGLYLHTDTALPASDYTAIQFWVHGGSSGGQSVNFHLNDGGGNYFFTVQANTWSLVTVPLAALGNPTTLSDLVWQDDSGNSQPTFYLDDISLVETTQIYVDALVDGWQDWSWDTTRNFDNAQPVHGGSASIAITYTAAWAGLYLHTDTALPASDYTAIRFWVHGGSTGGQSVNFHLDGGDSYPFTVQANTWLSVTVPFRALGNPITLSVMIWQDGSGSDLGQPTFYLDDISLIGQQNYVYLPLINRNYCTFHYFDDFSNPNSGWDVEGNDSYLIRYLGGEYQILLNYPNSWAFGLPNLDLPGNYRLEVDARQTSAYGSAYGMLFGIGWGNNTYEAYQFLVEPQTQKYLLDKRSMNGSWNALIGWTDASIINSGTGTNHLVVERIGSAIYLYINDVWVDTAYDSSFISPGRDVALYVDSYNQSPLDVRFDNFRADCLP